MARVVSGGSPLYTSEEFGRKPEQVGRIVPNQGTKLERFTKALQVADAVASNKTLGALGGLLYSGIKKVGGAIEEAGMVSQAERAQAEQEAANQEEAAKLGKEQQSLKEAAKYKLAESKGMAAPEETFALEGRLAQGDAASEYVKQLKDIYNSYEAGKGQDKDIAKFIGEGVRAG